MRKTRRRGRKRGLFRELMSGVEALREHRGRRLVNISEARSRLSELVREAAAGQDIVIARAGRPVARLTRLQKTPRKRRLGSLDGRLSIPDDFNRPQPDLVRAFEGD